MDNVPLGPANLSNINFALCKKENGSYSSHDDETNDQVFAIAVKRWR